MADIGPIYYPPGEVKEDVDPRMIARSGKGKFRAQQNAEWNGMKNDLKNVRDQVGQLAERARIEKRKEVAMRALRNGK
jgi:hypothetical protein